MTATCETCRHFTPHKKIDVPPEPSPTFRWLGINWNRDRFHVSIERMQRNRIVCRNECGWCHRMPETLEKHREDYCGEHSPAKDD